MIRFIHVQVGEGEKLVRALFAVARVKLPSVVFIDEVGGGFWVVPRYIPLKWFLCSTDYLAVLNKCWRIYLDFILLEETSHYDLRKYAETLDFFLSDRFPSLGPQ